MARRLLGLGLLAATPPHDGAGANLATNPNFYKTDAGGRVAAWGNADAPPWSRSAAIFAPGARSSLHFNGTSPTVYRVVSQTIKAVQPGSSYLMSADVMTHALSSGGYASVTASWRSSTSAHGSWPKGPSGTSAGWVRVTETVNTPADLVAGSFVLAVYARPKIQGGPTPVGQAWFGNVSLSAAPPPPKPCPTVPLTGLNLVANPDYYIISGDGDVCMWGGVDGQMYSRSTADVLPGAKAALRFENDNASRYSMVSQHTPLVLPGVEYLLGASVKTLNLTSSRGGYASIAGSWTNGLHAAKRSGGTWPSGPAGTTDGWVQVGGSFTMPEDAIPGSFVLAVYVRPFLSKDPTPVGVALFDNISVVHQPPTPLRSMILSPVYRGWVVPEDRTPVIVRSRFAFDAATPVPSLFLQAELLHRGAGSTSIFSTKLPITNASAALDVNLTSRVHGQGAGNYTMRITLINATSSAALVSESHNLTVLPVRSKAPLVSIDEESRLVFNGTHRHFPIGFIGFCTVLSNTGTSFLEGNASDMELLQRSPFDTVMPYGECTAAQLDIAHAHDIKIAFSLKDIFASKGLHYSNVMINTTAQEEAYFKLRIATFRKHPAVLAWYLNDEMKPSAQLRAHQEWAIEGDTDHPTWQVITGMQPAYLGSSDAFGTDQYPIGYVAQNASNERETMVQTMADVESARPVWQVIQVMNWRDYDRPECKRVGNTCHTPSYDEVRSMSWQAIAAGANGLFYYSLYDIRKNPDVDAPTEWGRLCKIGAEVRRFAPILLASRAPRPT